MSRTRAANSEARRPPSSAVLERQARRFLELKRGLEQLEYFCKGTVLKRMMKCGKANCACASDPAKRHGPYYELTYKTNGKTVNVKLSPEEAPLYKAASMRFRKLKTLLHRLDKLSQSILRLQGKLPQLIAKTGVIPISPVQATVADRSNHSNCLILSGLLVVLK